MSKKFKGECCAYCAKRDAITRDHVFSREFFLLSERDDLPQVPACVECNNDKSKLEHYLTAVLPFGGRHSAAAQNLASMVPKRLSKNAKLHRELASGQQRAEISTTRGQSVEVMTVPIDGERVEQLFAMIAKGLVWHHWKVYLGNDCVVRAQTVTRFGEQYFDELIFRRNARDRVQVSLGQGAFEYEGVLATDNSDLTAWRFSIYGGLAACEDPATPENFGSQIIVLTGPKALVEAICSENAGTANVGIRLDDGH
jgi:hypothetical protein